MSFRVVFDRTVLLNRHVEPIIFYLLVTFFQKLLGLKQFEFVCILLWVDITELKCLIGRFNGVFRGWMQLIEKVMLVRSRSSCLVIDLVDA